MNEMSKNLTSSRPRRRGYRRVAAAGIVLVAGGSFAAIAWGGATATVTAPPPPPAVTVATPLRQTVAPQTGFLGQFSAVDRIELRAQVGGTLTEIHFTDGQIVRKGDLLFVIDPRPYQIALDQAVAGLQTARAQLDLANRELWRAQQLKQTSFGTAETVDQRIQQQRAAQAARDQAQAAIRTAALNLQFTRVTAPFSGKIGAHQVSVGSLVAGSTTGGTTTLLSTLVSLDPIHLDFDMSENDFLVYGESLRRRGASGVGDPVEASIGDQERWDRHGRIDFIDNAVDRGSGTIHVRASFANHDRFLTPGEFARLRLALQGAAPALLVPADAVSLDQSQQTVMTVDRNDRVMMKTVETGGMEGRLRIVRAGLAPSDRVIIHGLMRVRPGARVTPVAAVIGRAS